MVHRAADGSFRQHAGGFLERSRGNERVRSQGSLGDTKEQGPGGSGLAAPSLCPLVFFPEPELIYLFVEEEFGISDFLDFHPTHHLANDDLDVLVVNVDALEPVDFLDFVHQVLLQLLFTEHRQDIVGVARAVHERLAGFYPFPLLHGHVDAARQQVLLGLGTIRHHNDFALALDDVGIPYQAINFCNDRRLMRFARLKELDHARQTSGDIFGLGGFTRNLGQHVAGAHHIAILNHQVSARGHQVLLRSLGPAFFVANHQPGLMLLILYFRHHPLGQTGDFIDLLLKRSSSFQVLELNRAGDFGQDRERVRIPFNQDTPLLDGSAVGKLDPGAVDHRVALAFVALVVNHHHRAVAVHGHIVTVPVNNGLEVVKLEEAVVLRLQGGLLADAAGGSADMEGPHGELGAGFADGLGGDHSDGLAHLDHFAGGQISPVATHANSAPRLAGQHGADFHPLNTGSLNGSGQVFVDLLIDIHDDVALVVLDLLQHDAANDAVAERLDNFPGFHDGLDGNAVQRTAVEFRDDDVLRHIHQAAREVTGVGRFERRVRQALARAVRRDEVLQDVEAFAEVGGDGRLDDFARRLGHQAAHS